jgi:hypothetical protein
LGGPDIEEDAFIDPAPGMDPDDIHHRADGAPSVKLLALDGLGAAMKNRDDDATF